MPLQATSGAASYDAFGGGVPAVPAYIEEVFQTWLYTGTGAAQTITNGIDLSTKGGLVWTKQRGQVQDHLLADTARGNTKYLSSSTTDGEGTSATRITSFDTTGYTLGTGSINGNTNTYASWTFRKQPKFFDVVTYTGDGVGDRTISHNLGAVPAVIIIKQTNDTRDWLVRTTVIDGSQDFLFLNKTDAKGDSGISNTWSTTSFTVSSGNFDNGSGNTYVAYLFASNAGGFGLTGTDNVISCGTYTGNGSTTGPVVTLGYEPQWVLIKRTDAASSWYIHDNMRGMTYESNTSTWLIPNTSAAEVNNATTDAVMPIATGFQIGASGANWNESGSPYIYIAIRRGPMKVPTSGTSVFSPNYYASTTTAPHTVTTDFSVDMTLSTTTSSGAGRWIFDRLRSNGPTNGKYIGTDTTAAEANYAAAGINFQSNTSVIDTGWNAGNAKTLYWNFKRAPSFFDEVCYTGADAGTSFSHNLGVIPELIIFKSRSNAVGWITFINNSNYLFLNTTAAQATATNFLTRTSTSVTTGGTSEPVNYAGYTYVAYLFATCAGVSKVGSYTGTATTLQIDCGFTAGARFVLIKRTDSTGDWYVWDTARGIVSGNDPYLLLNSTAAEVTSTDYIDTYSAGFELSSTAPAALNASGGSYIFLAIA